MKQDVHRWELPDKLTGSRDNERSVAWPIIYWGPKHWPAFQTCLVFLAQLPLHLQTSVVSLNDRHLQTSSLTHHLLLCMTLWSKIWNIPKAKSWLEIQQNACFRSSFKYKHLYHAIRGKIQASRIPPFSSTERSMNSLITLYSEHLYACIHACCSFCSHASTHASSVITWNLTSIVSRGKHLRLSHIELRMNIKDCFEKLTWRHPQETQTSWQKTIYIIKMWVPNSCFRQILENWVSSPRRKKPSRF